MSASSNNNSPSHPEETSSSSSPNRRSSSPTMTPLTLVDSHQDPPTQADEPEHKSCVRGQIVSACTKCSMRQLECEACQGKKVVLVPCDLCYKQPPEKENKRQRDSVLEIDREEADEVAQAGS